MEIAPKPEQLAMRRPVWIAIFLVATVHVYTMIWASHERGLAATNPTLSRQSALHGGMMYSLFFFVLSAVVIFLPTPTPWRAIESSDSSSLPMTIVKRIGEALLAGALALLASLPFLLHGTRFYTIPDLLAAPSNHVEGFLAIILLGLLIPFVCEVVFRGVLFRQSIASAGLVAASVGSSLLYAYLWPFPGLVPSFLLGLASSTVYWRSRSIVAAFLTNISFTFASTLFIEWLRIR
jgi:membrane protease YdiL (CAAX protease family)